MTAPQGNDQAAGAVIGGLLGFIKSLTIFSQISWAIVGDTIVLSAIGAMVGFLVTTGMKWIKSRIKK